MGVICSKARKEEREAKRQEKENEAWSRFIKERHASVRKQLMELYQLENLTKYGSYSFLYEMPDEVLEVIFKHMDNKALKQCRLVCRNWNLEILKHGRLSLVVTNDCSKMPLFIEALEITKQGSLPNKLQTSALLQALEENGQFIQKVNNPASLNIIDLQSKRYQSLLKSHQYQKIKKLKFSYKCKLCNDFLYQVLMPMVNLRELKLEKFPLLSCDFQEGLSNKDVYMGNPILWKLEKLIIYRDPKSGCSFDWKPNAANIIDGQEVQWMSKNITFLLNNIASHQMKKLELSVDTLSIDINSCVGRKDYRYEDHDLNSFICRHSQTLVELDLNIPVPMTNKSPNNRNFVTTTSPSGNSIKVIDFRGSKGSIHSIRATTCVRHPELLQHDAHFYDDLNFYDGEQANYRFWKLLCLEQKHLVKLIICRICLGDGAADLPLINEDFITTILQNNRATLEDININSLLPGTIIDGTRFKDSKLIKISFGEAKLTVPEVQCCCFINVHLLPKTVKEISLETVKLDGKEFTAISKLKLKSFKFYWHWRSSTICPLKHIPNFEAILRSLINPVMEDLVIRPLPETPALLKMLKKLGLTECYDSKKTHGGGFSFMNYSGRWQHIFLGDGTLS